MFHRSVVLVSDHSQEDGAYGLIMNHPTGNVVGDFLKGKEFAPLKQVPVHEGGPVAQDQLTFSAFWWNKKKGLEWAIRISAEDAIRHSQKSGTVVRAFVGYSGWTAGQLESEMARHSWIIAQPSLTFLGMEHDRPLWAEIMGSLSPLHRILAQAPANPTLN